MLRTRPILLGATTAIILVGLIATWAFASPATGVTPNQLSRGSFPAFKVRADPPNGRGFKVEAKGPIDVIVRQHTYEPGGSTGWHAHPYPVLITVKEGTLTFYEYGDKSCTPIRVTAGHGYVDNGKGHIARNETGQQAVDYSVIMAPVGAAFRSELNAPAPNCDF
jgi:hypothetical protein